MDESVDTYDVAIAVRMSQTIFVIVDTCSIVSSRRPVGINFEALDQRIDRSYNCNAFLTLSIQATPWRRMESSLASDIPAAAKAFWMVD